MLDHFSSHMGLAEPSTLEHFGALIEFVEAWERWAAKTIPPEVVKELDERPAKLQPLFKDLEEQFARLRTLMTR